MSDDWIARLPKTETHIHLGGAYRWETIRELHPDDLPESPPWLAQGAFVDFNDFRAIFFDYVRPTCGTVESVERHTFEVLEDLARQNVRYVEATMATKLHRWHGLTDDHILAAMGRAKEAAEEQYDITAVFLFGLNRHDPGIETRKWFDLAMGIAGPEGTGLISGVDLQGDERVELDDEYIAIVDEARDAGLRLRVHAGELAGPDAVRYAVGTLGARHISHGVRAVEDPALVGRLAREGVFLHVCPTSNVRLGVVDGYQDHPLRALYDAGCAVTVSSDDPLIFGADVTHEHRVVTEKLGFSRAELTHMVRNGLGGAQMDDGRRDAVVAEIDQMLA